MVRPPGFEPGTAGAQLSSRDIGRPASLPGSTTAAPYNESKMFYLGFMEVIVPLIRRKRQNDLHITGEAIRLFLDR